MFDIIIPEKTNKLFIYTEPCTVVKQVLLTRQGNWGGFSRFTPLTLTGGPFVTCVCTPAYLILKRPVRTNLKYDYFSLEVNQVDMHASIISNRIPGTTCIIIHKEKVPTLQLLMKAQVASSMKHLDSSMVPNKILKEVTLTKEQIELLKFDRSLHKVEQGTKLWEINVCYEMYPEVHRGGLYGT